MAALILFGMGLIVGIIVGFMLGFSRAMREVASRIQSTRLPDMGRLVIGLGCFPLVLAFGLTLRTWHFNRIAQRTTGTVIEMRETKNKDSGDIGYAPTFRFQDAGGSRHTVSSSLYSTPPEFHVGDIVKVLYRGDDPETARIDTYWQVWGVESALGIIGSSTVIIGTIMLFWPSITARFRGKTPKAPAV